MPWLADGTYHFVVSRANHATRPGQSIGRANADRPEAWRQAGDEHEQLVVAAYDRATFCVHRSVISRWLGTVVAGDPLLRRYPLAVLDEYARHRRPRRPAHTTACRDLAPAARHLGTG